MGEIWSRRTKRCKVSLITSSNWKGGIPKDPSIPKWLVKIKDYFTHDEYCPTDSELLGFIPHTFDDETRLLIAEAFKLKEAHNKVCLVNPEIREKERQYEAIIENLMTEGRP